MSKDILYGMIFPWVYLGNTEIKYRQFYYNLKNIKNFHKRNSRGIM